MQADSTACDEMPRHYALCHTNAERKREREKKCTQIRSTVGPHSQRIASSKTNM